MAKAKADNEKRNQTLAEIDRRRLRSNNIDEELIKEIAKDKQIYEHIMRIVNQTVAEKTKDLDRELEELRKVIFNTKTSRVDDRVLENSIMKLAMISFSLSELVEDRLIEGEIAESIEMVQYAEQYLMTEGLGNLEDRKSFSTLLVENKIWLKVIKKAIANKLKQKLVRIDKITEALKTVLNKRMVDLKTFGVNNQ